VTHHAWIVATLVLVFALMAFEQRLSSRHERRLLARGAVAPRGDVYAWMTIVYPLAFVVPAIEGWLRADVPREMWVTGGAVFVSAKALKYWAIRTLGERWSFRVLVLPGVPLIVRGPYRFLPHPNYAALPGEIAGAAMLVGGPGAGALFTILFGCLMLKRIRVEERAHSAASRGQFTQ
jgi:methyltransferase